MNENMTSHLRAQLPDIGDGLAAQCQELHRSPTPERCERLCQNLDGARRAILTLRERLIAEGQGNAR